MHMISERWMMQRCHIPALSVGKLPHVDPYTHFSLIWPNFLTLPYAVHSPRFSWPTITNFQNVHYVHRVWTQSEVVGCMDERNMMVVIHTDSHCALTAPLMTAMPTLTQILLVHFVAYLHCALSLLCKRQDDIPLIYGKSTQFGVYIFRTVCMTLAHTQRNYYLSQFRNWN